MASQKLKSGLIVGRWTLVGEVPLGKGGNGTVWKAEDAQNVPAAIKFLSTSHLQQIGDPEHKRRVDRFLDEIRFFRVHGRRPGILPRLDDHIPDQPSPNDRPWLATALAVPVSKVFNAEERELRPVVQFIHHVALTLAGLHSEGIFHRDLKPDNLFVHDGVPVIGDFGLVDLPGKEPVTGKEEILGPAFYVAPEMMTDAADVPAGPADVYSLAKTLWVLATGQKYPLPGEQRLDVPALTLSAYTTHPHAKLLDTLLERSTRHVAAERPTMSAFALALNEWLMPEEAKTAGGRKDLGRLGARFNAVVAPSQRQEERLKSYIAYGGKTLRDVARHIDDMLKNLKDSLNISGVTRNSNKTILDVAARPTTPAGKEAYWNDGECAVLQRSTNPAIYLWSGSAVQVFYDGDVRVSVGHILGVGNNERKIVVFEAETCLPESAHLWNSIERLGRKLIEELAPAVEAFIDVADAPDPVAALRARSSII